jgi:sterol 24-C-methyltransferase
MKKTGTLTAIGQQKAITGEQKNVEDTVNAYRDLFDEKKGGSVETREQNYMTMVNTFYNMVTDIYEYGWGTSFHFAPRHKFESFETSIARHECYMALALKLEKGKKALDLGCGVGGPVRVIARFSQGNVVGVNNNDYQLQRCKILTQQQGLSHLCSYLKSDFHHIPVEDNTFDAAFHVEAIEHSPDRVEAFKEALRVIKPGGYFAGYDWCVTDVYDPNDSNHVRIKKGIELGNGLPDLKTPSEIVAALKEAGFEVLEHRDMALYNAQYEIPWWDSLDGSHYTMATFKHTPLGRWMTDKLVWTLETIKLAPKGTHNIHQLLTKVAVELVEGGRTGIFSPMYFYVCRKPLRQ